MKECYKWNGLDFFYFYILESTKKSTKNIIDITTFRY